ncbi:Protein jagged-1, partial [Geodia barretti]
MLFSGNASYSHLELAFRLTCGPDSYGPDCTFCVPTNDSTGHYSCNNVTGEKKCLDGYQRRECNDCVPAKTCSPERGYCEDPGDCVCYPGFSGDDCSELVCSGQICNSSSCKREHKFLSYTCGQECVNDTCECQECPCEVECGENGECVRREEGDTCECSEGYRYNGELCETIPTTATQSGTTGSEVYIFVGVSVGVVVLIAAGLILISVTVCLRQRSKKKLLINTENVA